MIRAVICWVHRYAYKLLPAGNTAFHRYILPILLQKIQHIRHCFSVSATNTLYQINMVLTMFRLEDVLILRREARHREIPFIVNRDHRVIAAVGFPILLARALIMSPTSPSTLVIHILEIPGTGIIRCRLFRRRSRRASGQDLGVSLLSIEDPKQHNVLGKDAVQRRVFQVTLLNPAEF